MTFAYDDVPYDTEAYADAHPVAMATVARLLGLDAAPARTARVLEIGCGDGENLSAAATYLPDATFVGFDLAASAIDAGKVTAPPNVRLYQGDILAQNALGEFDYVIAHGMYSWVPPHVRSRLLHLMRASLAPNGIGFLSMNALPGWGYRRALRELALDRGRALSDPGERVRMALAVVDEIAKGGAGAPGYLGRLAEAAASYRAHVDTATPPDVPFSRYVFHDLLAECNHPRSVAQLETELAAEGLAPLRETPLRQRTGSLAAFMEESQLPFLQVLVRRDDAPKPRELDPDAVLDLWLWADFTPVSGGFKTSTGALVKPPPGSGLERAAALAPGFVHVRDLKDPAIGPLLLEGFAEGVFTLRSEPPPLRPTVAPHVRARAERALARGATSAVLTNAIHRSFRVPANELAMIRDGTFDDVTRDRFRRHLFVADIVTNASGGDAE